ncbi:MAG: hypothetical protein RQ842_07455 [Vulcanisaeta sp.]|jgi:hypothetical protein|nr:hypothetical protein [Vulcanisaeta sp.]
MPFCNPKRFLESLREVPERPGWFWTVGSVEYSQIEDRYRFCALYGPGLDALKNGGYARVLLDLNGIVVDVSVVRGEKRRLCMPLPKELNNTWEPLYGKCHVAYIVSKRLFLWVSDQLVGDWLNVYIHRGGIKVKFQA